MAAHHQQVEIRKESSGFYGQLKFLADLMLQMVVELYELLRICIWSFLHCIRQTSWIAVVTFPGCLLLSDYTPYSSLCNEQTSFFSIWLPLLGMLNCIVFLSSLFSMSICGAHFSRLQVISALLIYLWCF
ncbi:hypothetical protein K1719_046199 [Acacia pycnantha]|nr:hypothetical protein K1719_046199 [Acacia pycnantha]